METTIKIYNRKTGSLTARQVDWSDFRRRLVKAKFTQDSAMPNLWVNNDFFIKIEQQK